MNRILVFVVCISFAGHLYAASSDNVAPEKDQQSTQQTTPDNKQPRKAPPAPSFTPSEKVGADSAVSFPVDI